MKAIERRPGKKADWRIPSVLLVGFEERKNLENNFFLGTFLFIYYVCLIFAVYHKAHGSCDKSCSGLNNSERM